MAFNPSALPPVAGPQAPQTNFMQILQSIFGSPGMAGQYQMAANGPPRGNVGPMPIVGGLNFNPARMRTAIENAGSDEDLLRLQRVLESRGVDTSLIPAFQGLK